MRVELQPAFILHSRAFRDSSLILDCLTEHWGRLSLLARGARSARSRQRQWCQPFRGLLLSWQGKSQLKTLVDIEGSGAVFALRGSHLYCGFYLNELLTRALPEADACAEVYHRYAAALADLAAAEPLEPLLRNFELGLIGDLGFGIDLACESGSGHPLRPDGRYRAVAEEGLLPAPVGSRDCFGGAQLLAMARADYSDPETLRQAKRLTRLLLRPLIGPRPLKSRELFAVGNANPNRVLPGGN